jgi:hypothetical protein
MAAVTDRFGHVTVESVIGGRVPPTPEYGRTGIRAT